MRNKLYYYLAFSISNTILHNYQQKYFNLGVGKLTLGPHSEIEFVCGPHYINI